jgi:hypothetical protein
LRLEGLRERLEGVRERLEGVRERLEGVRERLEGLRERKFDQIALELLFLDRLREVGVGEECSLISREEKQICEDAWKQSKIQADRDSFL